MNVDVRLIDPGTKHEPQIEPNDHHVPEVTPDFSKMSEEERWRYDHQQMHEKHKGHEQMHLEMMLILIVTLVVAQVLLVQWKRWHFKSYQTATLVGMWIIPVVVCVKRGWYRFLGTWLIFSILTGLIARKASQRNVCGTTPRMVYKWFLLLHKLSYALGIVGYFIILFTLMGFNLIFRAKTQTWMDVGLLLLFYGLYYGVLGRDFAEICTDKMAAHIGYYTPDGLPKRVLDPNVCAVCDNKILVFDNEDAIVEKTYKLSCSHLFHEFCIRGWCIVGKKQMCPYCREKVDLKRLFKNPWEKPDILYGQLLDWIRYLVAWQPLIITLVQGINYGLGLE